MAETLPRFSPALIDPCPEPFDHPDWLFETKYDGFRALAYVRAGAVEFVSRTGYVYREFAPLRAQLAGDLAGMDVVLDGEIACLDDTGRSVFDALMRHRGAASFLAFDVLWHGGIDVRAVPLWKRKQILRVLVPKRSDALLYADSVARCGAALFRIACEKDLEGIVAKWRHGTYSAEPPASWLKIKNPTYSRGVERHQQFERGKRAG